jgi:hypothetical protein
MVALDLDASCDNQTATMEATSVVWRRRGAGHDHFWRQVQLQIIRALEDFVALQH